MTRTLELLEPEIQRQILLLAETPENIHNLIQASPRLYQVFSLNKEYILSAVARDQFHPTVLPEALIFAKVSRSQPPLSPDLATRFCEIDADELKEWQDKVSSVPESIALCELARNIKFFIQDYARNTLPIMYEVGQSQDPSVSPNFWSEHDTGELKLSASEIGRLQRAFCRFEIYRCLFATCSSKFDHSNHQDCDSEPPLSPGDQARLFLARFPDFQITEINCVRDYLFRRLRIICKRLEEEAVDTLPDDTFIFNPHCDVEALEWDCGYYFFTDANKSFQGAHFEHLLSLGLPYIRRILQTDGVEKRDLFLRDTPIAIISHRQTGSEFLTEAIENLDENPASLNDGLLPDGSPPFVYKVGPDIELGIPDSWQWAHPRGPPYLLRDIGTKGLRDWGYVFWDLARLRESGILDHDSDVVRLADFDDFFAGHYPSVQERLSKRYFEDELYSWGT